MRTRLNLVVGAVTAMVVIAFLFPLTLMVRELAADGAATEAQNEAVTIAPKNEEHAYLLAGLYARIGQLAEAYPYAKVAMQKDPSDPQVRMIAFHGAVTVGDAEGVVYYGERYLEFNPDDAEARSTVETAREALRERSP